MKRIEHVLLVGLAAVAFAIASTSCGDESDADADGDSDGDGDADTDADGDGDADADADTDADGDGDADADADVVEFWDGFIDASGPEECGNCTDEDGDGSWEACPLDQISLTPQLVAPGGTVSAHVCTRADPSYSCVDVMCHRDREMAAGDLTGMETHLGFTCWDYDVMLPTAGQWACTFRRLHRGTDAGCEDDNATARACALVTVE